MAILSVFLATIIIILLSIYWKFKRNYQFWKKLNIPYLPPKFPMGNFTEMSTKKRHVADVIGSLYEQLKNNGDYSGIYMIQKPSLLITNPEFAKTILTKDFNNFINRGFYFDGKNDPLSNNIFFVEGNEWKILRQKLSFAFTSGKMKMMFQTLNEIGDKLVDHIDRSSSANELDVKELMSCFTTDVVSSCIFGIEGNSIENSNSEFREACRNALDKTTMKQISYIVATTFKSLAKIIGYSMFNEKSAKFFTRITREMIDYRKENSIKRNDLMQIMLELMENEGLTIEDVIANTFIFFFVGFETSSTTLTYALYELALHHEIQKRGREDIKRVLGVDGKLNYELLNEMKYIDQIVDETLRKHPPVGLLHRIAENSYQLNENTTIPAGTTIVIPVLGFNHDPEIWSQPEQFDPDRFDEQKKPEGHLYSFMPFGGGHRACIGQRFALLQVKVGLVSILRNFNIDITDRTEQPLIVDNTNPSYAPQNEVWLKFTKIAQ